jgi:polyprenyl-phospho-N-acetylgalactosaminyl synthase
MLNRVNMLNKKIVAIVPVYNEMTALREVIISLMQVGVNTIIIVDDGSTTNIFQAIHDLPVHFLRHRVNLGQGAALQTGFTFAKKMDIDIVITFDADGQHRADDIPHLVEPIYHNEADVTIGSRFLSPQQNTIPTDKRIILKLARVLNFMLSGLMLTDAHNGLRALNKAALDKINFTENRMAHASELLFEIKKHKLRFKEVPVQILYTKYAKEAGQSPWESVKILFDLVLHKLFR